MSTSTDTPSEPRSLPLGAIRIPEGANPRRHFDERALLELANFEQRGFCFDCDADGARSCGCLLEFKNGNQRAGSYVTDPVFIADRLPLKLDEHETTSTA